MNVETVAIIGAGVSGLAAIKACLEENLQPACFEYFGTIGGTWNLTENHVAGQGAAVYASMQLNTSKHMSCFSDFPFPDDVEQYTDARTMRRYLQSYSDHFQLNSYIRFHCEVTCVQPTGDYDKTGRWSVTYTEHGSHSTTTEFDAVMLCSGRNRSPRYPVCPGMDDFRGETLHMIDYRRPDSFKDKVVLVIGNGNSACDAATDAVTVAKQVYMSTRDGFWVVPRDIGHKPPMDRMARTVYHLPIQLVNYISSKILNNYIDHRGFKVVPESNRGPAHSLLVVNDKIIGGIKSGEIVLKRDIDRLTAHGVVFTDGTCVEHVDVIMYATGYQVDCKFLAPSIFPGADGKQSLYRIILPTHLPHPTLCMVGYTGIKGGVACAYEMQTRWVVALWTNLISLPSVEVMEQEVVDRKREMVELYGKEKLFFLGIWYEDLLARDLGILPSFWSSIFVRPLEYLRFFTSPAFPMTLRLYGRHAWSGARKAIAAAEIKS